MAPNTRSALHGRAILPAALGGIAKGVHHHTFPVLLSVVPLAFVFAAVRPNEGSMTVAEVILVLTLVFRAIRPTHCAVPGHVTLLPGARVHTPITEVIRAVAIHAVSTEMSLIDYLAICCGVSTLTMFAPLKELALVFGAICPLLHTLARLFILEPLSYVGASIFVCIGSFSLSAVLIPVTFVDVAIRGFELAISMGATILEMSFIGGSIRPCQDTLAMAL
mmetsp:Transcript_18918/g.22086  ORF Transcript_18918/g.22086 Transcript_18918/m.22086 type:complete len:221 (+) Transcript_18918:1-663(+)